LPARAEGALRAFRSSALAHVQKSFCPTFSQSLPERSIFVVASLLGQFQAFLDLITKKVFGIVDHLKTPSLQAY
jgi:hypothetical protein